MLVKVFFRKLRTIQSNVSINHVTHYILSH